MKFLSKIFAVSAIALASMSANAELVTHGYLTSDSQYDVIADTNRGREYLRFDTFDMTYADTLASVQAGGIYEGWSVADSIISDDFINAMFAQSGENACSTAVDTGYEECGTLTGWVDGDFGESYSQQGEHYAYLNIETNTLGLFHTSMSGVVSDYYSWSTPGHLDKFSLANNGYPINLLMYRENNLHIGGFNEEAAASNTVGSASVPLPATAALLGLGLLGFGARRNKNG
jgi:hypothetical protein